MAYIVPMFDGGGGYSVDPDTVFQASIGFLDTKEFVFSIASGLAGDLGSSGGMAGADRTAQAFAAKYQSAARAVVAGIDRGGQAMAAISSRLLTMAVNYLEAENVVGKSLGSSIDVSSGLSPQTEECEPTNAAASLPEVTGAKQSSGIPVIGRYWPQGDTGKLRNAAATWTTAARLLDEAQQNAGSHARPVIYECSGAAFTAFQAYAATVYSPNPQGGTEVAPSLPLLENLSAACRLLAKDCESYADSIDHTKHVLEALVAGAGIITVVGIVGSFFTFGGAGEGAADADGAIAAEAATEAAALETAAASSAEAEVVAEAEQIVASAAARLIVTGGIAADVVGSGAGSASAATTTSGTGATSGGTPLVGPIPPATPPAFPLYSPAGQRAAAAWQATLNTRDPNYGDPSDIAYQIRVAGDTEYEMPGADGSKAWADGFRSADGAIMDPKNVRVQGCSGRTLAKVQENDFGGLMLAASDSKLLTRYQQAIDNPVNHAQFLEIETNDEETVGYWQFLTAENHITSNVRYVP